MTMTRMRWIAGVLVLAGVMATAMAAPLRAEAAVSAAPEAAQAAAASQPSPQPPPTPAAQDGFVPMDSIPDHDKLPAAPYLIGAYAVAWVAILFYVWSLWGRLTRVEEELKRLASTTLKP